MKLPSKLALTTPWVLFLLATGACGSAADPGGPTGPTVGTPGDAASQATYIPLTASIRLKNVDLVPRNYLIFEAELAAVVDPNLDPASSSGWIVLAAGEATDVRLEAIPGWTRGATGVYVYSWKKSVAYQVGGGTQWLGEGWEAIRVEL